MAYTVDEMVEAIRPIIGNEAADQLLQDAASVVIEELGEPADREGITALNGWGIRLNTSTSEGFDDPDTPEHDRPSRPRQSRVQAGMTLYHEMRHVRNIAAADSTSGDPTTQGPCGSCVHSSLHATDVALFAGEPPSTENCQAMKDGLAAASHHMANCNPGCGDVANEAAIALDIATQVYDETCP